MLSTQIIANTVLMLAFEEKISVTSMKLQKLIYSENNRDKTFQ